MRLIPSTMSTDWSMEMQSGLQAAMRSSRPPPPLMYRMMGTWGWVDLRSQCSIRAGLVCMAEFERVMSFRGSCVDAATQCASKGQIEMLLL
jgi:hypothetical protein